MSMENGMAFILQEVVYVSIHVMVTIGLKEIMF